MRLACVFALFASLWIAPAFAQDARVATVKTLSGDAYIVRAGQKTPAQIGAALEQGDELETGPNGAMGVTFVDNTTMSLGPKSRIALTEFVFDPNRDKYSFVSTISSGTFMFVSGLIGKISPGSVAVKTPVASIGIRGTRFLVKVGQP